MEEDARTPMSAAARLGELVAGLGPAVTEPMARAVAELGTPASRDVVGRSLERSLDAAKEHAAFDALLDEAEPLVRRLVAWLGQDFAHLANLLRHKQLGRRYPVAIVAYDPSWPARFDEIAAFLGARFGGPSGCVRRVEHFGSTAVPGLEAKPIIDVLVEVADFAEAQRALRPELEAEGYAYFWRSDSPPGHMHFAKGYGPDGYIPGAQLVHLHVAPAEHPLWDRLLFRDYLRTHPDSARRYGELKRALAERHPNDREAYTREKGPLVRELTELARQAARAGRG